MKDFFKGKRWDDYMAYAIMVIMILGMVMFFVGYYWGVEWDWGFVGISSKVNLHKVAANVDGCRTLISNTLGITADKMDIFTLMGYMDPSWGAVYAMGIVAIIGFSFIMLGILLVILMLIAGLMIEIVVPKIKAKKA